MDVLLELANEIGLEPKRVAATGGGEYHSACPNCGGVDRFFIQPSYRTKNCIGRYACRQCGIKGDTIQFCREIMGLQWERAIERSCARLYHIPAARFEMAKSRSLQPPPIKWQEKMGAFVEWASRQIMGREDVLEWLADRGIPSQAVETYKIGFSENSKSSYGDFRISQFELSIADQPVQNGKHKTIWIPKGIVIPTVEPSGAVVRVKIRRSDWYPKDKWPKYVAIVGVMQGMNIIGDRTHDVMIVVESELDAYALHDVVNDFAFVVAVGSNNKNPDNFTDHLARAKRFLLICHDNDDGGATMLKKWQSLYPHAKAHPCRVGKDIGEATNQGENLREWILSALPDTFHIKG